MIMLLIYCPFLLILCSFTAHFHLFYGANIVYFFCLVAIRVFLCGVYTL